MEIPLRYSHGNKASIVFVRRKYGAVVHGPGKEEGITLKKYDPNTANKYLVKFPNCPVERLPEFVKEIDEEEVMVKLDSP